MTYVLYVNCVPVPFTSSALRPALASGVCGGVPANQRMGAGELAWQGGAGVGEPFLAMVLQLSGLALLEVWFRWGAFARVGWMRTRHGACGVSTRLMFWRWLAACC